jgi:Ser/Thr protein kinase RdoA (MazF antagonist)
MAPPLAAGELRDPTLPALGEVLDAAAVGAGLTLAWRRSDPAVVRVRAGPRADTKYAPGTACVAVYHVVVERDATQPEPGFGVAAALPAGSEYRRLEDDPGLPAAAVAVDPLGIGDRLRALPALRACSGAPIRAVPVRYKPGRTCVVRYELGEVAAFGKVMAAGAERQGNVVRHLAADGAACVPPLLAVWADLGMIVQAAVTAAGDLTTTLAAARPSARVRWLHRLGRAAADLHAASLESPLPAVGWREDLEELAGYRPLFAALAPGLAPEFDRDLAELERVATTCPPAAERLGHGALRTDQLLADRSGRLYMLDLDGLCRADPARDLANLLGYLRWRGIRRPEDAAWTDPAAPHVLEGYAAVADPPDPVRLELFQRATLLRIAGRRLRSLAVSEWRWLPELLCSARPAAQMDDR